MILQNYYINPNTPTIHTILYPEINPFDIFPITNVLDNSIVLITLDICNYIRKYCCTMYKVS